MYDAAAKHGHSMLITDLVADFDYESGRMTDVIGMAAVRFGIVWVCRVVSVYFKGTTYWCVKMERSKHSVRRWAEDWAATSTPSPTLFFLFIVVLNMVRREGGAGDT